MYLCCLTIHRVQVVLDIYRFNLVVSEDETKDKNYELQDDVENEENRRRMNLCALFPAGYVNLSTK
jgi:hypothetical protein